MFVSFDRFAGEDDRVRVLTNETNIGLTRSLNRAIEASRGEYVARQDADDLSHPERFERQVRFLETHPSVAVVGTGVEIIDETSDRTERRRVLVNPSLDDLQDKNHVVHGSVMGRLAPIRNEGGYDEFFEYCQDYDLWLRLAERHDVRNIARPLYTLREHRESIYIKHVKESTLYSMFARGVSLGSFDQSTVETVRREGITRLYDHLNERQRAAFHQTLAQVFIRYGRTESGRSEALKAIRYDRGSLFAYVLYGLSLLDQRQFAYLRTLLRKVLNGRVALRNAR
jgi:glycosyltransferase involved in cell wall biosynthesis